MAPGGKTFRYSQHFGENVLLYGSHEWLPYSKNVVRTKLSNTNFYVFLSVTVNCFPLSSFPRYSRRFPGGR